MKHRRRKTALLSAAAAAVLVLQGSFAALAASPQFAYDADTWAKLQDNVMEYSELPYLVQEYNPTYLNNQTTYQAGRDTKNAKEVQDKQYNQANDLYDSADNLRDQADQIEGLSGSAGHGKCVCQPDVCIGDGRAECIKNAAVGRCLLP